MVVYTANYECYLITGSCEPAAVVFLLLWLMNMIILIRGVLTVKTEQMLTVLALILLCNVAPSPKIKFLCLVLRHW